MKKLLLILGLAALTVGVFCLLFAALNLFGYYHVLDGTAALYSRLHRRAFLFLAGGLVLAAGGAGCLFVRAKR